MNNDITIRLRLPPISKSICSFSYFYHNEGHLLSCTCLPFCYHPIQQTFLSLKILKDAGVYSPDSGPHLTIGNCPIDLIPFDDDIMSLELPACTRDCYLSNDTTSISMVAGSLQKLQRMFGTIANVKCKGKLAKVAYDLWSRMEKEEDSSTSSSARAAEGEIDTVLLIDRAVDWVSPLVTPLTYEALVDEIVGINHGLVPVVPDAAEKEEARKEGRKPVTYLRLNNNDELFMNLRDISINSVGPYLQERSKNIRELYKSRPTTDGSVKDIQDFVKKIPHLKRGFESIQHHIRLTEQVGWGRVL